MDARRRSAVQGLLAAGLAGTLGLLHDGSGFGAVHAATAPASSPAAPRPLSPVATTPASPELACERADWPLWQAFQTHFIQADGRVIDASVPQLQTTSEGQSYAMFFALVANDPVTFDRLWRWTIANLAGGDLVRQRVAWQWGKNAAGGWGVLDPNSATDADLWFVYALLEAGRLWQKPEYGRDALVLMNRVIADALVELPGFGKMLLPGAIGFVQNNKEWRLNASYLPIPVLRRLALADAAGPWTEIANNTARLLQATTAQGFVADWVGYHATSATTGEFTRDRVKGYVGSYDAIRTYLWAGMMPASDPLTAGVRKSLGGMAKAIAARGLPPESVQTDTGMTGGDGPFGFSAALIPYLLANRLNKFVGPQYDRVGAGLQPSIGQPAPLPAQPPYYNYVLSMYGLGWAEQRYQFMNNGTVLTAWEKKCRNAKKRS